VISALGISNFKRFTDALFALRPLTVLTGLNGTGKSTTIQALLLARQLAEAGGTGVVQLNGPYGLALGEAHEVLHPDAVDSAIEIRLESDRVEAPSIHRFEVPDEQALYLSVTDAPGEPLSELTGRGCGFTYLCAERLGPRDQLGVSAEHPDRIGVGVRGEYTAQVLALHDSKQVRAELLCVRRSRPGLPTSSGPSRSRRNGPLVSPRAPSASRSQACSANPSDPPTWGSVSRTLCR
jgi:hypothetical protein